MKSKLDAIKEDLEAAYIELEKANKGVKSAANRLGARMRSIRKWAVEIGKDALEIKKSM